MYNLRKLKILPIKIDSKTAFEMFGAGEGRFDECAVYFHKPGIYFDRHFHPVIETTDNKAYIFSRYVFKNFFEEYSFVPLSQKEIQAIYTLKNHLTVKQKQLVSKSKLFREYKYVTLRMVKFFKSQGVISEQEKPSLPR